MGKHIHPIDSSETGGGFGAIASGEVIFRCVVAPILKPQREAFASSFRFRRPKGKIILHALAGSMTQLKAFIGHSFLDEDDAVVRALLNMFDDIAQLMPEFEWDHALAAEPKELSVKVKEKMQGKNLFIGICTAREYAIRGDQLGAHWWPNRRIVKRSSLEPKTSDWILQEIGFAVRRNMNMVLLLEDGVRRPGGLQGDWEYIPFSRERPDTCRSKVVSMLRSLSPRTTTAATSTTSASTAPTPSVGESDDSTWTAMLTPDANWVASDYVSNYRFAIRLKEKEAEKKIREAFAQSPFSVNEQYQVAFTAAGISSHAAVDKDEWFEPLIQLRDEHPTCYGAYLALAERYSAVDEHESAATYFEEAARFTESVDAKIFRLSHAAMHMAKAGRSADAELLLQRSFQAEREDSDLELARLEAARRVWQALSNDEMYFAAVERLLEIAPDKVQDRFVLAHKYSEIQREADALYHYRQCVKTQQDNGSSYNNLGVAAEALHLPATAMDAYRKAMKSGVSLAAGNFAFAFLKAGFVDEAIAACETALSEPDPDIRVLDARAEAQRTRKDEDTRETELINDVSARRQIYRHVGRASLLTALRPLPPRWKSSECELTAVLAGNTLVLGGTFLRRPAGLLANAFGGLGAAGKEEEIQVQYTGKVYGLSFVGSVIRSGAVSPPTLIGKYDEKKSCIGFFNAAMSRFEILEDQKEIGVLTAIAQ